MHEPRKLDKFWDERRTLKGLQPNGYIERVFKEGKEVVAVIVKFHKTDEKFDRYTNVEYRIEEIQDHYVSQGMGYMLHIE